MKTHEHQTEGDISRVADFCMDSKDSMYWAMWDCYSTTYPNHTPFQAWRSGFRECVKMLLKDGVKVENAPVLNEIYWHNIHRLKIWSCVGAHVDNGIYAMLGARTGSYMSYCTDWDYIQVRDFEQLQLIYNETASPIEGHADKILEQLDFYAFELKAGIGLELATFNISQSKYITDMYAETVALGQTYYNKDPVWKSSF
jgi:hypothetical protein